MKRFYKMLVCALVLLVLPVAGGAEALSGTCGEGISWALEEGTLTVSGNGATEQEFTIPNVAPGTYDLVVSKPGHLKYTVKNVVVGDTDLDLTKLTDKPYSTITLLCGDINRDGSINVTDLNEVWDAANFNKNVSAATNKLTDINGDGSVNVTDLNVIWDAANFNKGLSACTYDF